MKFIDFLNESKTNDKDVEKLIIDNIYAGEYVKGTATLVKETKNEKTYKFVQKVRHDPEAGIRPGFTVGTITVDCETNKVVDEDEGLDGKRYKTKEDAIESL